MIYQPPYTIILASQSPRRQELLKGLDLDFTTYVKEGIDENYPAEMDSSEVAGFLSHKKAQAYLDGLKDDVLLITADTIVVDGANVLGKPTDKNEAVAMLSALSGKSHQVITGVTLCTTKKTVTFSSTTEVTFATMTLDEINYYIDKYKPYDKAGSYGIQEWIGYIGVESINGSYFNVMGLPVQSLYKKLKEEF